MGLTDLFEVKPDMVWKEVNSAEVGLGACVFHTHLKSEGDTSNCMALSIIFSATAIQLSSFSFFLSPKQPYSARGIEEQL